MKETIIEMIRHGEPVGGSRYRGHSIDDPLSEKGWQQMRESVGNHSGWSHIISSPLIRCASFAYELGDNRQLPVTINDNLKEIGFGAWEGKTKAQLRKERMEEFEAFYRDPVANTPENAEKVIDFHARIGAVFDDLRESHQGKQLLVVAHAGVIRAMITYAVGAPVDCMYRLTITNGGISRLRLTQQGVLLDKLNGVAG